MNYPKLSLWIDGQAVGLEGREAIEVLDPATCEVLGLLPKATAEDVDAALHAAEKAFHVWRKVSAHERGNILRKAATLMRERTQHIATLITLELGKPFPEAEKEVATAAEMFEWAAEEGRRAYGRIIPGRVPHIRQMAIPEPIGPVAAFAGWNAPAITPSRKIAGALAAGCSIVIKPAEETPAIALEIVKALRDAGLPAGAANMVFGDPGMISKQLVESPIIRKITFTGSTAIGRQLAEMAGRGLKRCTLELGGHAPVLVFADAEIETATANILGAKLRNSGQICTSPTRMFVHESIYEKFVDVMARKANAWRVGNGFEKNSQMGPMANPRRIAAMQQMVDDAVAKGATVSAGGTQIGDKGWFWRPTVLSNVNEDMLASNVEPFGPMALVKAFSNTEEALKFANRLPFGLASYVFTTNIQTATHVSEEIQSGVVCINNCVASLPETPFGGVKDSGYGKEGGIEGLQEFMQVKYIAQV
ncbi:NAD-dependent succinate-semialdehyde dehydrogenase [Paraburkholderia xenovorans]